MANDEQQDRWSGQQPSATYGDVIEGLRRLAGRRVSAQMRSSAGGDNVTVTGVLEGPTLFADQAVIMTVGEAARMILHFDQQTDMLVAADTVMMRYESGAVFHCYVEGGDR